MDSNAVMMCECGYILKDKIFYNEYKDSERCYFCGNSLKNFKEVDYSKTSRFYIVRNLDVFEVAENKDTYELIHYEMPELSEFNFNRYLQTEPIDSAVKTIKEIIKPHCFFNEKGQRIYIGYSRKVHDALGLPFESFNKKIEQVEKLNKRNNDLQVEIKKLKEENEKLSKKINRTKNMSIKDRIFNFIF